MATRFSPWLLPAPLWGRQSATSALYVSLVVTRLHLDQRWLPLAPVGNGSVNISLLSYVCSLLSLSLKPCIKMHAVCVDFCNLLSFCFAFALAWAHSNPKRGSCVSATSASWSQPTASPWWPLLAVWDWRSHSVDYFTVNKTFSESGNGPFHWWKGMGNERTLTFLINWPIYFYPLPSASICFLLLTIFSFF